MRPRRIIPDGPGWVRDSIYMQERQPWAVHGRTGRWAGPDRCFGSHHVAAVPTQTRLWHDPASGDRIRDVSIPLNRARSSST
jgi:hypothetical protein